MLGYRHPDYLLRELTSRQIAEWMAYFGMHPFGQDHSDFLVAQLTAETSNRWRGQNEMPKKATDFLPLYRAKPMDSEQVKVAIRSALRLAHGDYR